MLKNCRFLKRVRGTIRTTYTQFENFMTSYVFFGFSRFEDFRADETFSWIIIYTFVDFCVSQLSCAYGFAFQNSRSTHSSPFSSPLPFLAARIFHVRAQKTGAWNRFHITANIVMKIKIIITVFIITIKNRYLV